MIGAKLGDNRDRLPFFVTRRNSSNALIFFDAGNHVRLRGNQMFFLEGVTYWRMQSVDIVHHF